MVRGRRGALAGLSACVADARGRQLPVRRPEPSRYLAERWIAARVREQLQPKPEEPRAVGVRLDCRKSLAGFAWRWARACHGLLRHLSVDGVDALLQQFGEELLLRAEVRVEGAARVAGLIGDRL